MDSQFEFSGEGKFEEMLEDALADAREKLSPPTDWKIMNERDLAFLLGFAIYREGLSIFLNANFDSHFRNDVMKQKVRDFKEEWMRKKSRRKHRFFPDIVVNSKSWRQNNDIETVDAAFELKWMGRGEKPSHIHETAKDDLGNVKIDFERLRLMKEKGLCKNGYFAIWCALDQECKTAIEKISGTEHLWARYNLAVYKIQ